MNIKIFNINVKVSIWLLLILIMLIVTNEINNYLLFISFIFVHELSHIIIAKYLNVRLNTFYVLPVGFCAQLDGIENLNSRKELLITIAGPMINLIIAICSHILNLNYIALVNLFLGLFNLLPIKPLDGYRITKNIYGTQVSQVLSYVFTAALLFLGVALLIYVKNYSLFLITIYVIGFNFYSAKFNMYNFIKDLMNADTRFKNNSIKNTNLISCSKECLIFDIIKQFEIEKYNIIYVIDNDKVFCTITQSHIINNIKNIDCETKIEKLCGLN